MAPRGGGATREERRGRVSTEPERRGVTGWHHRHRREGIRRLRDRDRRSR